MPDIVATTGIEQSNPAIRVLLILLRGYQIFLSPLLGARCRFEPSCSRYAVGAITKFGAARGTGMALKRLACCHPLHPGGYDPVP